MRCPVEMAARNDTASGIKFGHDEMVPTLKILRQEPETDLASLLKICVIVFAVSFLLFAISPEGRLEDLSVPFGGESVRVARSLATHGTFADPFAVLKTGETAHVAPVYPVLYAGVLRFLGDGYAAL